MNTKTLFDNIVRTHNGVADHTEDSYSFLNRSARQASDKVRSLLEQWYSHFPEQHRLELAQKFRTDFSVGFFELLLHEILLATNHEVEVHPPVPSELGTHPDFRARDSAGRVFFLEATIATDQSQDDKSRDRLYSTLYDQISQLNLPDYFLHFESVHNPSGKQPSGKKFKGFISDCVRGLDYEALSVFSELGAIDNLPKWTYRENDLEVEFGVIPVSRESRANPDHRPIGIYPPGGTRVGGSDGAIRDKIIKKAGKYGGLGCPFVIAVNCLSVWGTHKRDEIRALFGTEEPDFSNSEGELRLRGKPNGAWYSSSGPTYTRVSGVILTRVFPWNLPKADATFYLNPWGIYQYEGGLTDCSKVLVEDGKLVAHAGRSYSEIFALADDWPGQLFDF